MKDIVTMLLASGVVLFSLLGLLSAAGTLDRTGSALHTDQQRVSSVGLLLAFKR
jgi:hypothetical protein